MQDILLKNVLIVELLKSLIEISRDIFVADVVT